MMMIEMASFIIKGLWAILVYDGVSMEPNMPTRKEEYNFQHAGLNFARGKEFVFKPSSNVSG